MLLGLAFLEISVSSGRFKLRAVSPIERWLVDLAN